MTNGKRLIDADALIEKMEHISTDVCADYGDGFCQHGYSTPLLRLMLSEMPTVDAVEVVHGRWIKYKDEKFIGYDADGRIKYRNVYSYNCDKCGHGTAVKSNYCPACGAKMEGVKEVGY